MYDTIEIIDGMLCVLNADGHGRDAVVLTSCRNAQQQIPKWTVEFAIHVAVADRKQADGLSQC
jgi:hypothetical protein